MHTDVTAPDTTRSRKRALVVSSVAAARAAAPALGREAYSYRFVYNAFAPLLDRWAPTTDVDRGESRLDFALRNVQRQGLDPIHLGFLPLHLLYLTAHAPTVAFPFWEFPDIPNTDFGNRPRNNWVRVADRLALILTACNFTRDAFRRAGVHTPVRVVPVPVRDDYFGVPPWEPGQKFVIDCPCTVVPHLGTPVPELDPWKPSAPGELSLKQRLRYMYLAYVRPRVPNLLDQTFTKMTRARLLRADKVRPLVPPTPRLELSGIVYTTIFNPFDFRKNWDDLLTGFLFALRDREDATLVIKLAVCPELAVTALNGLLRIHAHIGIQHKCKIVFITEYLDDAQMVELARGSTYYINTSRAEGACLPLQDYLAAGRPGLAPRHTALTDYFDDEVGFVVPSHPEPTHWPLDPDEHHTTTWHRLVWQALHDQVRASYDAATQGLGQYQELAANGRARIRDYAAAEVVWPRLAAALHTVAQRSWQQAPLAA